MCVNKGTQNGTLENENLRPYPGGLILTYTRLDQSLAIGGANIHDTDLTSLTAALDRMLAVLREASESDTRAPVRVLAEFDARRVCDAFRVAPRNSSRHMFRENWRNMRDPESPL